MSSEILRESVPVYRQIAEKMRESLGQAGPNHTVLIPERELSIKFGVSRTTVRRALAELKQERVIVPRRKVGNLIAEENKPVCLNICKSVHPDHLNVIRDAIEHYLRLEGREFITVPNYSFETQMDIFKTYGDRSSGFIIYPAIHFANRLGKLLSGMRNIPIVMVNTYAEGSGADFVGADDVNGTKAAAEHLIGSGRRKIVYVSMDADEWTVTKREHGYTEAMTAHGLKPVIVHGRGEPGLPMDVGYMAARQLMAKKRKVDAIMCVNDMMAVGVYNALTGGGIKVKDIPIFGFGDDIELHAHFNFGAFPISTVAIPRHMMGVTAAMLLLDRLERRYMHKEPRFTILETSLVIRDSVTGEEVTK